MLCHFNLRTYTNNGFVKLQNLTFSVTP